MVTVRRGSVESFDELAGLGVVRGEDNVAYPFHCTQIADGSRSIDEGTTVWFEVVAGHRGRWEASSIRRGDEPGGR
jgi:CspA family cold shock protein